MRADAIQTARVAGGMALAACLSACMTAVGFPSDKLRELARFNDAAREIGNTYVATQSHTIHACSALDNSCLDRSAGGFTIDDSVLFVKPPILMLHLVFDDGATQWLSYDDFVMQKFTAPSETRLRLKIDEKSDQIRAEWGVPDEINPKAVNGLTLQQWTYRNIGTLSFKDNELIRVELTKSLLAAK